MFFGKKSHQSAQDSGIKILLHESRRLLEEGKTKSLSIVKPDGELLPEIQEIFENLSGAIAEYVEKTEYNVMKYQLANEALHTGLWDMDVIGGDPVNPNNTFIWSNDFRKMLGFQNENDFPNKLNSWSDRLHPDDKERTLNAFAAHLLDRTGKIPYDVKYQLKMKNGEYGYFQATGGTVRDKDGAPIRVAGLLLDMAKEKQAEEFDRHLGEQVSRDTELINGITKLAKDFDESINSQDQAVEVSSRKTEEIVDSLKRVSEISQAEQKSLKGLTDAAGHAQEAMQKTKQSVQDISQLVEGISSAIQIIASIAANTNLLSMNAAIEAAHAGDAGKGFAVVADEIRRLSENTRTNSVDISRTLKSIIEGITTTSKQTDETDKQIVEMSKDINSFAGIISDIISTFNKLSEESHEITMAFNNLKQQSISFREGYSQMVTINEKLADTMRDIAARRNMNKSA